MQNKYQCEMAINFKKIYIIQMILYYITLYITLHYIFITLIFPSINVIILKYFFIHLHSVKLNSITTILYFGNYYFYQIEIQTEHIHIIHIIFDGNPMHVLHSIARLSFVC